MKVKKVKARVEIKKIMLYKGSMVYVRRIDGDIFQYDLVFDGQIYSNYIVITPARGKKKLTKQEVIKACGVIFAGAVATVDTLLAERGGLPKEELKE